jgi:uncharacterized membrane-anchored protein
LGTLLALGIVNYSIFAKERIIASGEVIYLELLPVDPRSLMQGDYMALRFQLAQEIESARRASSTNDNRRIAPLHLNDRSIAALGSAGDALHIRYRIRSGQVWLGTNAYFFEEGTAERYTGAKYGEFRLNRTSGEAVLVGLRDEKLQAL